MDDTSGDDITDTSPSSSSRTKSDDYEWSPHCGLSYKYTTWAPYEWSPHCRLVCKQSESSSPSSHSETDESEGHTAAKRPHTAERFVQPGTSLSQLCQSYILMHWEKFPIRNLSLLPLLERKRLLDKLPIADVCNLEDTEFTKGIDMEAFWTYLLKFEIDSVEDADIFVKEWGAAKFAREVFYGCIMRNAFVSPVDEEFYVSTPGGEATSIRLCRKKELTKFLYAIRNFSNSNINFIDHGNIPCFIPPRFQKIAKLHKEDCIDAMVNCFRGEFPKILLGLLVDKNTDFQYIPRLLFELRYLGMDEVDFRCPEYSIMDLGDTSESFEFVQKVVSATAANLEVINLYGIPRYDGDRTHVSRISLDEFCVSLASHPSFWSQFRQLKLFSSIFGYVVSQNNFNGLISAYLSAPTDHAQRLQFSNTKIVAHSVGTSPEFDQKYLQFKSIVLKNCNFQRKFRADSESVSSWLGQSIIVLECEEDEKALLFKVKNSNTSSRNKKRRLLDSDDEN